MKLIDLHVHSTYSDGTFSPAELVDHAIQKGLTAFALTDHDTISGIQKAQTAASKYNLEIIPGIEFSTAYKGKDIHILGLDIDCQNIRFLDALEELREERKHRNQKMIDRLLNAGVSPQTEAKNEGGAFQGMTIVVTGTLSEITASIIFPESFLPPFKQLV